MITNNNPSIRIYADKIKKSIMLKIKTRYYQEILTLETMKLLFISTKISTICKRLWIFTFY